MQTIIMAGAGGTGSHLLPGLLKYNRTHYGGNENWQLGIFDGDNFETGNLDRQLFSPELTTVNKAVALASMYPGYPVKGVPEFIGEDNIAKYIRSGDIVLICADNFTVRKRIELHGYLLDDLVVINGGNENVDGSVQLWVRKDGQNVTPPLSYMHPEIRIIEGDDRAAMDCLTLAELPGGGQHILANMTAANHMLTALWRYHQGNVSWTELQFDLEAGHTHHLDQRLNPNWERDRV